MLYHGQGFLNILHILYPLILRALWIKYKSKFVHRQGTMNNWENDGIKQ